MFRVMRVKGPLRDHDMKMKICPKCNKYTLKDLCPLCNTPAVNPHPPKFSPEDKYGKYRRLIKKESGVL